MKKFILTLLTFLSFYGVTQAQNDHRISQQEIIQMPSYLNSPALRSMSGVVNPPASPVRASAEWEEIDALMITWTSFTDILAQIVKAAQTETQVYIICSDSNNVKSVLMADSIPLINIQYLIAPFNSIWCRDYGQWNVYTNDVDSLALIDWKYNRPRAKDDTVPSSIQNYTGLPMYSTTASPYLLVHTGGNFMCDGFGTGFSSRLITHENPSLSEADIDTIMRQFMGISRYIKMDTLPYDEIHHIDMHLKLLDEETLLVGEYPQGIADGPQIEANLQYILANYNSVYGTPYKVVRIPMPPDALGRYPSNNGNYRTYTNSVFVNKGIIMPFYDEQYDTTAVRIYQEALPGYKITGIDCNNIITSLGAIHCITKEVSSSDPLLISHQSLHDTYNSTSPYPVTARIQHRSGVQNAEIYYRTDTTVAYQSVAMSNSGGNNWTGNIPAQVAGSTVYYYVRASSVSGKSQSRPMPAPDGYWKFNVLLNTSIEPIAKTIRIEDAFPNPSHGITCIPVSTTGAMHLTIVFKNILGEIVEQIFDGMNQSEKKYFINTSGIAAGVYAIEITADGEKHTQKIVVR